LLSFVESLLRRFRKETGTKEIETIRQTPASPHDKTDRADRAMSLGNSPQKSEQKSEQTRIQENMSPLREMICHPVRGDLASAGIIDLNSAERASWEDDLTSPAMLLGLGREDRDDLTSAERDLSMSMLGDGAGREGRDDLASQSAAMMLPAAKERGDTPGLKA
jgi:hypothetical protein